MQLPLLALLAVLPHALGATLHHQHAREHAALAAHMHERDAAAAAAPAAAPLRRRKTCTRRPSSLSLSASATPSSAAPSSSAVATSSAVSSSAPAPASTSSAAPPPTSSSAPKSTPKPTSTKTSSTAQPTSSAHSSGGGSSSGNTPHTPNGIKAGIAGLDSFPFVKNHIGMYYDWTPSPAASGGSGVPASMLWGGGTSGNDNDAARLSEFKSLAGGAYKYVIGFEEPDCPSGGGSSGMSVQEGANIWNDFVANKRVDGTLLISPSMCHQTAETWLTPFEALISTTWDITNVHINKNSMAGVQADIEYYYNKYGRTLWVTEFACVDDSTGFVPCTDQGEINSFISQIVDLFEADDRVAAYAYSDGEGLGSVWPTVKNGQLSASGQAYLNAISKYH